MSDFSEDIPKLWPKPGDRLVHKFRGREGEVIAKVLSVNRENGKIAVQIEDEVYASLSAAAKSISGYNSNGWLYWGLKTRVPSYSKSDPLDEVKT